MKTIIIGAGRSGVGVARLLAQDKMLITLINEHDFPEHKELEALGITVEISDFSAINTKEYDRVIKAPGVAGFPEAINEIEVASKLAKDYNLYAISGTNGKTTTTKLFYSMLFKDDNQSLAVGNVGYSMSQAVYDHGPGSRNVALEVSSFQMNGLIETHFKAYALLNLSPDHLDRYSSLNEYYESKLKMLYQSDEKIVNVDDENIMALIDPKLDYLSLSIKKKADIYLNGQDVYFKEVKLFSLVNLKVPGEHNLLNAMFASSLAYLAGVSLENIHQALHEFVGVEHRLEYVRELEGVRYYNDSKATNPESTEVCLKSFSGGIHLIAGGYDKKVSFDLLRKYSNKVKGVYLFGESKHLLKEVFPQALVFETMLDATKSAHDHAETGDVVVLSPASASFDQFKDFEERGIMFKDYIKTL